MSFSLSHLTILISAAMALVFGACGSQPEPVASACPEPARVIVEQPQGLSGVSRTTRPRTDSDVVSESSSMRSNESVSGAPTSALSPRRVQPPASTLMQALASESASGDNLLPHTPGTSLGPVTPAPSSTSGARVDVPVAVKPKRERKVAVIKPTTPAVLVGDALEIVDGVIATGVSKRVPQGVDVAFEPEVGTLWAWTKVRNTVAATHITHLWKRDGEIKSRVQLNVGKSSGWRTWSRKRIGARDVGEWTVEVIADDGTLIDELAFTVAPTADEFLTGQ